MRLLALARPSAKETTKPACAGAPRFSEGLMNRLGAFLIGAAVAGLLATSAHAQGQTPGWYIGVQGGWTHRNDDNGSVVGPGIATPFRATTDEGFNGGAVA